MLSHPLLRRLGIPARPSFAYFGAMGLLFAAYVSAAVLGLRFDAVSGFATLVWPPTGIALAALLLFGYRLWPAILLGAFVANLITGAAPAVAIGIGIGNTLEAVVGTYLLRATGFHPSLGRVRDVLLLIGLALVATAVSATIGVTTLWLGNVVNAASLVATWRAWWVGDMLGALIITPLLLTWWQRNLFKRLHSWRLTEALALVGAVTLGNLLIFSGPYTSAPATYPLLASIFLPLSWAALRFGPFGVSTALFLLSVSAVIGTAYGQGPFVRQTLHDSLLPLQLFMGIVAAMTLTLAAAITERTTREREVDRVKSEFVSLASHQLRTPLTIISWHLERILRKAPAAPLSPQDYRYLQTSYLATRRLFEMVSTLLNLSRIEARTLAIEPHTTNLTQLVTSIVTEFAGDIAKKNLEVQQEIDQTLPEMVIDAAVMRMVLQNLLSNAIKYTPPRGKIRLAIERQRRTLRLTVADTGYGIPLAEQGKIFTKFFRADNAVLREPDGNGLGLYIVKSILEQAGGSIQFKSHENHGTTFSVLVPLAGMPARSGTKAFV